MGTVHRVSHKITDMMHAGKPTGWVGTMGKNDIDIVELEALQRRFCALDDARIEDIRETTVYESR